MERSMRKKCLKGIMLILALVLIILNYTEVIENKLIINLLIIALMMCVFFTQDKKWRCVKVKGASYFTTELYDYCIENPFA